MRAPTVTPVPSLANGPHCAIPHGSGDRVQLGHGSGGRMSGQLVRDHFLPALGNAYLAEQGDAAVLPVALGAGGRLAMSTDTFVVSPLEFPGGNIGHLAVHGTLNDVAMMGAEAAYLTAGFILEEGLPIDVLERVVRAMGEAARAAGVPSLAGETNYFERG